MPDHHFISYSSVDGREFALRLADLLEAGPPALPVWVDRRELRPGEDWDEQLVEALRTCASMLFVMTRDSVLPNSVCKREWTRALAYKKPIIPLRLHPDAELPFRLEPRHYIDFTGDFKAALAQLRNHLVWLRSPQGLLQELKYRRLDVQRDLNRAADDEARHTRAQAELDQLTRQIEQQQRLVDAPEPTARTTRSNIERPTERERKSEPSTPRRSQEHTGQPRIFISYRRADSSGHAGRLYDHLTRYFGQGQVFMDIETIEPGADFRTIIDQEVGACHVLLALIGRQWLDSEYGVHRRRLDNPDDFVRLEISSALQRNIRVIPVLVQGATMPNEDALPAALAELARKNAFEISDARWNYDVRRLSTTIQKSLSGASLPAEVPADGAGVTIEQLQQELHALRASTQQQLAKSRQVVMLVSVGNQLRVDRKLSQAIDMYKQAQQLEPDDPHINYVLGKMYSNTGAYQRAIATFEQALKTMPDFVEVHMELGLAYRRYADAADPSTREAIYRQAEQAIRQALVRRPDYADALSALGGIHRRLDDYQQALNYYLRAADADRHGSYGLNNIASLYWRLGKEELALGYFARSEAVATSQTEALNEQTHWALYDLALAQLALGKPQALDNHRRAIKLTPAKEHFCSVLDNLRMLQQSPGSIAGLDEFVQLIHEQNPSC